ncbi:DUF3140 domain-containing protein [Cryptosporangium japonicum]|uniref:DUF3140 domain-containing protein n=1 Tax=Cryptosporangium japonicum TaxID=80872 RepID=A0ABN0US17_9ACTN
MAAKTDDEQDTWREFKDAVNMAPARLEKWLESDESKSVGASKGTSGGESVGHDSGRKIVSILRAKKADLTEADYAHMRKVVGYVHRHLAQRPSGDVRETPWRYSLMNWGHDPA